MSTPIALPSPHHSQDSSMSYGSYGTNGSFNPASYTRHVLGSPLSWRAPGSFGGRFYPGGSPVFDSNDFKSVKLSSSIDSDRGGSLRNALNAFDREGDLCRNYTCCGLNLTDLHALLEHFEEVHVVVVDPQSHHPTVANVATPTPTQPQPQQPMSYFPDIAVQLQSLQTHYQQRQHAYSPDQNTGPFDPDDMELDLDTSAAIPAPASHSSPLSPPSSGAPSPPDTPISTPLSSYSPSLVYTASQCSSPLPHTNPDLIDPSPISAFETTTVLRPHPHHSSTVNGAASNSSVHQAHNRTLNHNAFPSRATRPTGLVAPDAFNAYAGYSDYSSSMPGTVPSPPTSIIEAQHVGIGVGIGVNMMVPQGPRMVGNGTVSEPTSPYAHGCVPPALLFSNSNTPATTPPASRLPSPSPLSSVLPFSNTRPQSTSSSQSTPHTSTTLSRPASSLLLSKPFKCPKPNCNKSYKQANGLKYHITHGSCNFAPPKDLEHVQALLASKRRANASASAAMDDAAGNTKSASSSSPTSPNASFPSTPSGLSPSNSVNEVDIGFGLTDSDLREVEREAARRVRPFACGVGDCQRRYKNMNGLRYHYQHSGDHGAIGLALLAGGVHECLVGASAKRANCSASAKGSAAGSRQGSRERERTAGSVSTSAAGSGTGTPVGGSTHGSGQFPYSGFTGQHQHPTHSHSPSPQQQHPSQTQHAQTQMAYQAQFAQHQHQQYQQGDATALGNGMYLGMNVNANVEFGMSG